MNPRRLWLALCATPLVAAQPGSQTPALTFAGIGLHSRLDSVALGYPHSQRVGDYIYVAAEDSRQHIFGIGISGTGAGRRVRISFEEQKQGGRPGYPACATVESAIERRYGPPDTVRRFSEEASERADRVWRRATEELTLACFRNPAGRLWAEAVIIVRRTS